MGNDDEQSELEAVEAMQDAMTPEERANQEAEDRWFAYLKARGLALVPRGQGGGAGGPMVPPGYRVVQSGGGKV
ncbi:MAG: hypothetical protein WCS88_04000 [Patescibacteria group bacterium]|jgi:hypothetical protein